MVSSKKYLSHRTLRGDLCMLVLAVFILSALASTLVPLHASMVPKDIKLASAKDGEKDTNKEALTEAAEAATFSPSFPGGDDALHLYLAENLKYPKEAYNSGSEGSVSVRFKISRTGKIEGCEVVDGLNFWCNTEALRVISEMPEWDPAKRGEIPVNSYLTVSMIFREPKYEMDQKNKPQYPGGKAALGRYIRNNLVYPSVAKEEGVEGQVLVRFVVSGSGEISQVMTLEGLTPQCDMEAERLVKAMPRWIPAKLNGKAMDVDIILPINFELTSKDKVINRVASKF